MLKSTSPTKENEAPADAHASDAKSIRDIPSTTPPARSGTLSWQKRPASRGGPGSRPLSMVAAQNATQRSLGADPAQEPASATEQTFSKDQIAQALGSKDPAWFRQTADRGLSSAAYRRNQVEDEDRLDMTSVKAQLPGMSAEKPKDRPPSHSDAGARLGSPVALNLPRRDEPSEEKPPVTEQAIVSPSAGRTSPVRSASPTKGMGGFVQSAMMKRSDSVKRWSVTSPPGLKRADSVANRGTLDRGSSQVVTRPQSTIRGGSTTPGSSRPTSQHGEREPATESASKPSRELSVDTTRASKHEDDGAIPTSPSKTMDPRRWSPTKSSWLESALNRPETPKLPPKPNQSQPSWMADLNKTKTGRSTPNTDTGRPASPSHKHQVSIGGLMRQSPVGEVAKPNTTGLGGIYSPPPHANRPAFGHLSKPSVTENIPKLEPAEPKDDFEKEEGKQASRTVPTDEHPPTPAAEKRPSVISPPPTKAKPETPPKKDFRATLKQRTLPQEPPKAEAAEFKNVFGNLRRTKTQNYVAPDVLKDNILRGKAGLNQTDGPKKSERKDEFKEAILQKREGFKKAQAEGKGVTRTATTPGERALPEGLAKRAELGRSITGTKQTLSDAASSGEPKKVDSQKPVPGPKRILSGQSTASPQSSMAAATPTKSPSLDKPRRVSTEVSKPPSTETRALPSLQKETSAPSRLQQGRVGAASKLADRFNPALAGMLARGPPPTGTSGGQTTGDSGSSRGGASGDSAGSSAPGPQLTHMTKNRARGPRRKAPTASTTTSNASAPKPAEPTQHVGAEPAKAKEPEQPVLKKQSYVETETEFEPKKPAPLSIQQQVAAKAAVRSRPAPLKPEAKSADENKAPVDPAPEEALPPSSPRKLNMNRMSVFMASTASNDSKVESKEPKKLTHQRTGSRSPIKSSERTLPEPSPSPTKSDRDSLPSMRDAPRSPRFGASVTSPPPTSKPSFDGPRTEQASPRPKSRGAVRPLSGLGDGLRSPGSIASPARSPTKQASDVSTLLTEFFGPDRPKANVKVDPAEVLMNRPSAGAKITSHGFQMFQILGDGKKLPVSAQNERVLFEREMYVCAHNFTDAAGRKLFEVYFWVGDEVPESTAEDALLFVQREAKSLGGKVVKLRQGKETSEFIQALGGVIIIRRGSSIKYDSLAPSMLCGRRYLGQVAFDEVDFTAASLCAGFVYLITQGGKCYVWKGKGSDVTEMSCARLVGMDLALTGELLEHEDGSEPATFWAIFDGEGSKPHSADHWRLKPSYDKYCSRLFCSDADSRQQIFEISPFGQVDLSPFSIYVLDAFFEMYIVVGARANSQYTSFRNALDFAQEYAILAAGMEDRPFVPVSTVVLEGIPRDLKRVFRKWDDARSPTVTNQPAAAAGQGLRRGRSLRVVTLNQALQALSD
ncbi:hypothetical protein JDV02_000667 [Purpureocillium takamizusanense]|nr:uncharacterized protein JDV02_000667 [Purpureocillium takamizusanense]UNI13982.1 hypothetical protein JDV02_000667 [Purpureocillium takamizusanense]